ncbi:uncharacterized protein CcaverHIS019_0410760 [Cutaneotrichosporon cavernicola]|uniref:Glycosyltransferase family 69 protein n=1 Tax=Cutaneotrichosporon cavernicola TaxID=279322 RepID=A0AA48L5A8_9TREE|nr:uncharacterized protein CcaverHIS019_0410760 [Cutaneotrichosporon cavernicola]BEI92256.1 hypothetical protein CcaverHIS019_0410760 [Cutaneotrichosporon cavernicola]BEJ00028.1 hypothetical protein CcaverHIS631_0410700 [Cutaneotrichosporon cavernicola]BEJ07800.1 hypothetical protein CcaverHIS641_0410690 [Cutaneotrichosporon cavernicola]
MGFLSLPTPFRRSRRDDYEPLPRSPVPSTSSWESDESFDVAPPPRRIPLGLRDPAFLIPALVFLGAVTGLFAAFPFPTTIHAFLPLAGALAAWVAVSWTKLAVGALRAWRTPKLDVPRRRSATHLTALVACTALMGYWLSLGITPRAPVLATLAPPEDTPRYFIAANLYNNEHLLPRWTREVLRVAKHLGPERTFVSIYESNSVDATPQLLTEFGERLTAAGVAHRIVSDVTERWWPYSTSPERIRLLADARNRALEPLQSPDAAVRLPDYHSFTKVLFLNDVVFSWDSAIRLLGTSLDGEDGEDAYDLACGMDFAISGLYDTWVARDVCGAPFRIFWPYVKDEPTIRRIRNNRPFEVSACWNGIVAFPARAYLYQPTTEEKASSRLYKRGWKMIDNSTYPNSVESPTLTLPLQFRDSGVGACDHSECFLFSYDLHRLYPSPERPPRIIMNPDVRVAYRRSWYKWHNGVLRIPVVEWWLYHWSHGVPNYAVDWLVEWLSRRRDYCTWGALSPHLPARCPPLPGPRDLSWNE